MLERREPRPALPDARGVDRPHYLHRPVGQGQPQERLQGVAAHGQSPRPNMAHRRAGRAGHLPGDDEKYSSVVPRKPQSPHNAHRDGKEADPLGLQDHIRPVPGRHGVDLPPGMGHPEHGRQVYGHRIHPRSPLHVRQVRIQRQAQRHQPRRGSRESVPVLFAQGRSQPQGRHTRCGGQGRIAHEPRGRNRGLRVQKLRHHSKKPKRFIS